MNKKIILTTAILSTTFLASCGTAKLWTFEEELKAEQQRYVANVDKMFANSEEFTEGKISSSAKGWLELSSNEAGKLEYTVTADAKQDTSDSKMNFLWNMTLNLAAEIFKDTKIKELAELAWAKIAWTLGIRWGVVWEKAYFSVDDLALKVENPTKNPSLWFLELINFDTVKKQISNKWLSVDFSEVAKEFAKEYKVALTQNKQVIANYKEFLKEALTWDVYSNIEKTTYEGKEAYKFQIDDAKFKKYLATLIKNFLEKNKDLINSTEKTDLTEYLANIEKELNENISVKSSEGYLVRTTGNDVALIVKDLTLTSKEKEGDLKISYEILDNGIKFSVLLVEEKVTFSFDIKTGMSGFDYTWVVEADGKKFDFNGKVSEAKTGSTLATHFDFNLNLTKEQIEEFVRLGLESVKTKIYFDTKYVKDDSITVDEKAIIGDNKPMNLEKFMKEISSAFQYPKEARDLEMTTGSLDTNTGKVSK